ncbi:hypothetical protein [Kitasatospora sp. NPDC088134]|uniref:hypothetical protein n=1 Tax=Kitasatospora sp. NPDC088134 TaxID=3364071 RepID=UPI00381495D3
MTLRQCAPGVGVRLTGGVVIGGGVYGNDSTGLGSGLSDRIGPQAISCPAEL